MPSFRDGAGMCERLRRMIRSMVSGPDVRRSRSAEDWTRWSQSLAAEVCDIVAGQPCQDDFTHQPCKPDRRQFRLTEFFERLDTRQAAGGPDRPDRRGTRNRRAVGGSHCVEWERILDAAVPLPAGRIRLYAGYLGALFGYLPTAAQIPEGGYEVEGFQPLFGLSGHFEPGRIGAGRCRMRQKVRLTDLEQAKDERVTDRCRHRRSMTGLQDH